MSDAAISLLILAITVALFVWNRFPVEVVAIGSALALYATGVITFDQFLSGFGDAAVIMIAALFVVSEGLEASGVTAWAGQALSRSAGGSATRALLLTMLLVAMLTATIGLNGAVAALLPMAVVLARRVGLPTSRMLMPLAFAGSAGGLLLLTGSPVNVVISQAADDAGLGAFGLLEFSLIGIPIVIAALAVILLIGPRLLPDRTSAALPPDLSAHARTLVEHYSLEQVFHLRVTADSPLAGRTRQEVLASPREGLRIITVLDGAAGLPSADGQLHPGDRLTVLGDHGLVGSFAAETGTAVERIRDATEVSAELLNREVGVIEAVVPPRSRYLGREVHSGSVLDGAVTVLAVQRGGVDRGLSDSTLRTGDVLLLEGPWSILDELVQDHSLLLVNAPDLVRRQAVPRGRGSSRALVILACMVLLLATGLVPAAIAALLAAGAMILARVVSAPDAYRTVSWSTVLLVAGMFPMAIAIQESGAGAMIAEWLVDAVGGAGPTALLAALAALSLVFGQLISNTATALVMIPIGLSAAEQLAVSGRTVLMSICVACAAAFMTPVATPANLMVMGPGGYRFGDYWKLGLPLMALFFLAAVFVVPLIWRW